jgi:hypothetical protein
VLPPLFTVVGMDLCEEDWYTSDNNLRGTPRGSRKKPNAGSSPWARHGHGMASVNQTRRHCVNQMGRTHSKPLVARHDRGTAWARHTVCMNRPYEWRTGGCWIKTTLLTQQLRMFVWRKDSLTRLFSECSRHATISLFICMDKQSPRGYQILI